MASTPMDLDYRDSTPANGTSLNITRSLNANNTSQLSDVVSTFRPTKVGRSHDPSIIQKRVALTPPSSYSRGTTSKTVGRNLMFSRLTSTIRVSF